MNERADTADEADGVTGTQAMRDLVLAFGFHSDFRKFPFGFCFKTTGSLILVYIT